MKIPVYIVDSGGNGVASLTFSGSEKQRSVDGAAMVNAPGTVTEIGGTGNGQGFYYYSTDQTDMNGKLLILRLLDTGGSLVYAFSQSTPVEYDFKPGTTGPRRYIPFFLVDNAGVPITGAAPTGSQLQVSINGGAWTNGDPTRWHSIGGGAYYYEPTDADIAFVGLLGGLYMVKVNGVAPMTTYAVQVGSPFWVNATIVDPGEELSPDPDIARWTPIRAVLETSGPDVPIVVAKIGSMWWTVYDGTEFAPFFREHSTLTPNVTDTNALDISILPNGGWWRTPIEVKYLSGQEMEEG